MVKVAPQVPVESSDGAASEVLDMEKELLDDKESNQCKVLPKKPTLMGGFFSMRAIIILLIFVLLVSCSVFIWLASFIGSSQALQEISSALMLRVGEKVQTYITSEISPYAKLAINLAEDFNNGFISRQPPIKYLFSKHKTFLPFAVGVFFPTELYTYLISGVPPNEILTFGYKPLDYVGVTVMVANETDGSIIKVFNNDTKAFVITKQAYWTRSFELYDSLGVDRVYGDPYVVKDSGVCIYYTVKMYDPTVLASTGAKKFVGLSKVNLSLNNIQNFLKKVSLIGEGYVIVTETNYLVIGASINSTALDGRSRVSIFGMVTKDAGKVMTDAALKYGSLDTAPTTFEVSSNGVGYIINRMNYTLENINWYIYLVVYKSDIEKTTNINTAISVGVAVGVVLIGLACSFLIGHLITQPLRYLESQFMKIKTFDLESVLFVSSKFKEVDSIYTDLHEMVKWLNEFKSFIPENVFNQLRSLGLNDEGVKAPLEDKKERPSVDRRDESGSLASEQHSKNSLHSSFSKHSKNNMKLDAGGLFKLGLSLHKEVAVLNLKLYGFSKTYSPNEITSLFGKIASGLSTLAKTMQVTDLQIISVEEYQLTFVDNKKKSNIAAMESALKICKVLDNLHGKSGKTISFSIGISTGSANIGNLGNNSLRCYSIVGPLTSNAKSIGLLAKSLGCKVLVDEHSLSDAANLFVTRPVDRFELDGKQITSLHEVLRENVVDSDEWLYEVEQQKANQRFKDFQGAFTIFMQESLTLDEVNKSLNILNEYLNNNPQDKVARRLVESLDNMLNISRTNETITESVKNYRSTFSTSLNNMINSDDRPKLLSSEVVE